jgi:hypothetical protein
MLCVMRDFVTFTDRLMNLQQGINSIIKMIKACLPVYPFKEESKAGPQVDMK